MSTVAHSPPAPGPVTAGPNFWRAVFGTVRPVAVEIGPGRGEFLLATARAFPQWNFLGIEASPARARCIESVLGRARVSNARIVRADANCVIDLIPSHSVDRYYVLFPDPWWKRRHHRRRLLTTEFVRALRRTLAPAGTIHFATDVRDYFAHGVALLSSLPELERDHASTAAFRASTSFARKALQRGDAIHAAVYRRGASGGLLNLDRESSAQP